ncbi:MAG: DNA translocase FtsK [Patescibacteria group bacterium]|nr:DNA translocase FtsK [Patescibacteria group bacterium]
MARKKASSFGNPLSAIPAETRRTILSIALTVAGVFLTLAAFGAAGIAGSDAYRLFAELLGAGYFLVPALFFVLAAAFFKERDEGAESPDYLKLVASIFFIISGLGFVDIASGHGGIVGHAISAPMVAYFDIYAAMLILGAVLLVSLLLIVEGRLSTAPFVGLWTFARGLWSRTTPAYDPLSAYDEAPAENEEESQGKDGEEEESEYEEDDEEPVAPAKARSAAAALKALLGQYTPPPLSLLERDRGRPGVGDIKGNANIIKRTLQNFGIQIELDEISIGPSVTRYAIKPAEGVRLQKIVALQNNLELALAAHPVRIEAPIPGKSLVGIEVPNSTKVTVGLGTILESPDFVQSHKPLVVALGRDIAGGSHFANVARMPHVLIAGATGSGKSVTIHTLITSLLYRSSPQQLRFIMIDPKRVELTLYRSLPHLLTPVITDAKKAIMALRWAGKEMERRYNILEEHRVRDVESYHQNILAPKLKKLKERGAEEGAEVPEALPYIVVVIDELADIMQSFPRELEAAVVRLAQMSRAVGIHLVLSTQRPSVNVITGLIKANVPTRIALQVASQIDSRTILDQGGAEKLLGSGDMLYLSGDMSKPVRLQSAFISEKEVKSVVDFIAKNNEPELPIEIAPAAAGSDGVRVGSNFGGGGGFGDEDDVDDDVYQAARAAVLEAGKASTSYLQRKLRIGYARAARIIDLLEERGVIGPGDGAKPREILDKSGPPEPAGEEEV